MLPLATDQKAEGSRSLRLEACRAISFCYVLEEPAVYSQVSPESRQGVQEAIARTELSLAWQRTTSPGHPALLPPPEWGGVNAVTAGLIELPGRGERRPFISGRAWRTRAGST